MIFCSKQRLIHQSPVALSMINLLILDLQTVETTLNDVLIRGNQLLSTSKHIFAFRYRKSKSKDSY